MPPKDTPKEYAPVKVVEFKLSLTDEQTQKIDLTLNQLKWVWNRALSRTEEFYKFHRWDPESKTFIPRDFMREWQTEKDPETKKRYSYCLILDSRSQELIKDGENYPYSCPIFEPYRKPLVEGDPGQNPYVWVQQYFRREFIPDWCILHSALVYDFLSQVFSSAWQAYKKGIRKKPRYKRKTDHIKTMVIKKSGAVFEKQGRYIKVRGFGKLLAKGLDTRIPADADIRKMAITKKATGYYLQLTVQGLPSRQWDEGSQAVGVDIGLQFLYATSEGQEVEPPKFYRKAESKLGKAQRRVSARKRRKFPPKVGSNNYKKAQAKIARRHERIARQRKGFNHEQSTALVESAQALVFEDFNIANLIRSNKPKERENGKGYARNGQAAKRGLNKSFADAGCGQFRGMCEAKSSDKARFLGKDPLLLFDKVPAHYTSQDCPKCGARHKKSLSQRTHQCPECGHIEGRDTAAAKVILSRSALARVYSGVTEEVTPVELALVPTIKQESQVVKPGTPYPFGGDPVRSKITAKSRKKKVPAKSRSLSSKCFQLVPPTLSKPKKRSRTISKERSLQNSQGTFAQLELWGSG
jgi:putative transposase